MPSCVIDGVQHAGIPLDAKGEPAFLGDGGPNWKFDWNAFRSGDKRELIRQATSACNRDDCRIMERGAQSGLVGYTPTYDRNGNLLNKPVGVVWRFSCLVCGRSMSASAGG